MKKILIAVPGITEECKQRLVAAAAGNDVRAVNFKDLTREDVDWAEIAVGNIPVSLLHGQKLEFLQLNSAGADAYVVPGVLDSGTKLSCCTGAYSQAVAEHGFAATLTLIKKLHLYRDDQLNSFWADEGTVSSLNGATVLVMGLGDIGRYYARMAKAFGAYVIGVKRREGEKPDYVDELFTTDAFDRIAGRADVIFSVMPGTPATTHFYTEERFRLMKKTAVFVNCGRGTAVSADVLYKVLSENIISCAAVDVFEQEPLPASSPLWGLKNLLVTPHASGFLHLPVTLTRITDICERNLKAFLAGKEIINEVDFSTGYKK